MTDNPHRQNCYRSLRQNKHCLPLNIFSANESSSAVYGKNIMLNVSVVELAEYFPCRARDLRHQHATGVLAVRKMLMMRAYYLYFYYCVFHLDALSD